MMLLIPYSILIIEDDDDRDFMEHIYLKYQRIMYHEIFQLVHDPWATEDILQNTLVNLINHINTLRSLSNAKLINYIISASKNTALTEIHRNSRSREILFDNCDDMLSTNVGLNPEFFVLQREWLKCLAEVWSKLDERYKYLLTGRYILHKSYLELGKELKIKPDSVRMAITRAKRKAYALMKDNELLH